MNISLLKSFAFPKILIALSLLLLSYGNANTQCGPGEDTEDPTITCPADVDVLTDAGVCGAFVDYEVVIDDNCPFDVAMDTLMFSFTGSVQTYTVPSGVTNITIELFGASGGGIVSIPGGAGGYVQADIDVTPGDVLNLYVGGEGTPLGVAGYNGGGSGIGGSILNPGSGGGGASDIRIGGNSFSDRVLVAGGGGGSTENGGASLGGPGGGLVGGNAFCGNNPWGCTNLMVATGGGQAIGGLGGTSTSCMWNGNNGTLGQGGDSYFDFRSSGGGGGYYGGGGAHNGCAGAGGSSFTDPSATNVTHIQGFNQGDGQIIIYENVSNALTQTNGLPSGSVFPVGTTTNTFVVTDASGNTVTCSFDVTVTDDENPMVECPIDAAITTSNLGTTGDCAGQLAWDHPDATDNCDILAYTVIYQNPDGTIDGPFDLFQTSIPSIGPEANRNFEVGTTIVTYTVDDVNGNSVECSWTVTVTDDEDPEFVTCPPAGVTVDVFTNDCTTEVFWDIPTAEDNCEVTVTQTSGPAYGSPQGPGTYTIEYTATDAAGNTDICTFDIEVIDTENPVILNCPTSGYEIAVDENCEVALPDYTTTIMADENCGPVTTTQVPAPGTVMVAMDVLTVTITVADTDGNSTTCTFDVTAIDDIAPTIECPEDIEVSNGVGICGAVVTFEEPIIDDFCSIMAGGGAPIMLSSAGASGSFGPTQAQVDATYGPGVVTINTQGIQEWTVPATGIYRIEAVGATGGNENETSVSVGHPANMAGDFMLNAGDVLKVMVGQHGFLGADRPGWGGGGGTFVTDISNTPLLVAGGCGSGHTNFTNQGLLTQNASLTENGKLGVGEMEGGWPAGNGANGGNGGDGAGFFTDGTVGNGVVYGGVPPNMHNIPQAFVNGGVGDQLGGGFGGGAGVTNTWGGGAGGYSGGQGAVSGSNGFTGGGGGSFNGGTNQNNILEGNDEFIAAHGRVIITPLALTALVQVAGLSSGSVFPVGTTTNTFVVTDASGNTASCSFDITVTDDEAPEVLCTDLEDLTLTTNEGECQGLYEWTIPTPTDNCGVVNYTVTYSNPDGSIDGPFDAFVFTPGNSANTPEGGPMASRNFAIGTTTVTYYVEDAAGNTSSCDFVVSVTDDEDPVFVTCPPAGVTVDVFTNDCTTDIFWSIPTAEDNCDVTVAQTGGPAYGSPQGPGTYTIEYTATDASGNTDICTFDIEVIDTENPVILNCPTSGYEISVDENCEVALPDYTTTIMADENCGPVTTTQVPAPGTVMVAMDVLTVTITVADTDGNSTTCTFDVTAIDDIAPTIECPEDVNVTNDGGVCGAVVDYEILIDDNCPLDGAMGTGEILFVSDCGTITEIPAALTAEGYTVTTVLNDHNGETDENTVLQGDLSAYGLVIWQAGGSNCFGENHTATTINNLEAYVQAGGNLFVTGYDVVASPTDNQIATLVGATSGSDFGGNGNLTVLGPANELTSGLFDIVGTTISSVGDWDAVTGIGPESVDVVGDGRWTLRTTPGGLVAWLSTDQHVGSFAEWNTPGTGYYEALRNFASNTTTVIENPLVQTAGLASGSVFPVGTTTNTFVLTDASGNTSTCSFDVTVTDDEAPVVECPEDVEIPTSNLGTPGDCFGQYEWEVPTPSDNCALISYTVTYVEEDGIIDGPYIVYPFTVETSKNGEPIMANRNFDLGVTTVTYAVEDVNGNTSTCSFTVTVVQDEAPEFLNCPRPPVVVDAPEGWCSAFVNFSLPIAVSNCEDPEVTQTDTTGLTSGDLFPVGLTILEFTATDAAGNTTVCEIKIVVNDFHTPPVITCPEDLTVVNDLGNCGAVVTGIDAEVEDNCADNVAITYEIADEFGFVFDQGIESASGVEFPGGTSTLTYTAYDQPIILITEVEQTNTFSGIEIGNVGPAAMDLACAQITRIAGLDTIVYTIPNNTVLNVGSVYTYSFDTLLMEGETASYAISFLDYEIDQIVINTGDLNGANIFRIDGVDNDDESDWNVANDCVGGSFGTYNPQMPVYTDNGTTTSLQAEAPSFASCTTNITVLDIEAPVCATQDTIPYVSSDIAIMDGMCITSVVSASGGVIGDININDFVATIDNAGAITASLTSPSGVSIELFSKLCEETADIDLTLDDDATSSVLAVSCSPLGNGNAYMPVEAFKTFYGEDAAGDWTLSIYSDVPVEGTLDNWTLEIITNEAYAQMDTTIFNDEGECAAEFIWTHPVFTDNCCEGTMDVTYEFTNAVTGATSTSTEPVLTASGLVNLDGVEVSRVFEVGTTVVTYTLTDLSDNPTICGFTVTVEDNEAPTFPMGCQDITVSLDPGDCAITLDDIPAYEDNCGVDSIYFEQGGEQIEVNAIGIGVNEITLFVVDIYGNVGSCTFIVEVLEYNDPTTTLGCNNNLNISLDPNCEAVLTADMILEGGPYGCYDNYCIVVLNSDGVEVDNFFDLDDVGETFEVSIVDCNGTGNSCWGYVTIEEKLFPEIECPADIELTCNQDPDAVYPVGHPLAGTLVTGEAQMLTCEVNGVISYVDELIDYGTCEDPRVELTRIWTLNDGDGNSVSCNQLITFAPYNPLDVDFPADLDFENSLECTDVASNPELTNPSNTGVPTFGGESIIGSNYCDISIGYFDEFYQDVNCPSAYTILRYWKIENECLPIEIGVNPYTHVQRIKVRDIEAPEVLDLADVTISVDPWDCVASYTLPTGVFEDNCSDFEVSWSASYGQVIGNELTNILKGVTTVTAKVTDACGNYSYGSFEITAIDSSPPVVVAEATHTISLSTTGVAKLYAEDLDDGSFDGCGPVAFFAKRMDDGPNCSFDEYPPVGNDNAQFNEAVFFCCDDVSDEPIMVQFQVCDDANMDGIAGNEGDLCNLAMVEVYVQDKLAPVIICPDNMSISCTDLAGLDLTDTELLDALFGTAEAAGTCTVEISQVAVGNESCGAGVIFRNFTASNTAGTTSCQQIITVTAGLDEILTCSRISFVDLNNSIYDWCLVNDNINDNDDDLPALEIECGESLVIPEIDLDIDGLCTEAGLTTTVDTFQFAGGACQKYLIHYEVIDQCIFDDNFVDPVTGEIDPYHTDNGYFEFYLEVDAFDTEAPTPDCEDLTLTATSCTGLDGEITVGVTDNCTEDGFFGFQWRLDVGANNTIDFPSSGWYSSSSVSPAQVGLSEFPIGVHRIYWLISDGCGNDATCSQLITIVNEDKAPTPYCIDGLSVAVMPSTGTVALWANDFDAGSFDNCEGELLLSMIPEQDVANATTEEAYDLSFDHPNVTQQPNGDYGFNFDCSYIPNGISAVLEVRIYVTDANGNWDYCTANLRLDDNLDACEDDATGMLIISGEIYIEEGEDIEKVEVILEAEYPEFPKYFTTLDNGLFAFYDLVGNIDYTVNPGRNDDFLNGVTTLDIVLIQKHILGIEVLESPYKLIAADVNSDCKVTGIDLVQLRKLILGKYEDDILPDNNSWRFVKEEFEFIDDQQPCVYDEVSEFVNLSEMAHQRFYGMKIGDINGSVEANFASISDTRSGESFELLINDREIASDLVTEVPVYVSESDVIYGFQMEIVLSDAELIDISSELLDLTESNIQRIADGLRISFDYASGLEVASDQRLFTLRLRSNSDLELSEVLMINQEGRFSSEVYVENLVIEEPILRFNDDNGNTISEVFSIGQNEPNPFKDKTTIDYNLPATGTVNLRVSDISGKILYSSELTGKKGMNSITLTEEVINSTGVLYYEIEFDNQKLGKKMIKID